MLSKLDTYYILGKLTNVNKIGPFFKHHVWKGMMERSIALCSFNLTAGLRWVVGFKTPPPYLWERDLVLNSYMAG
jgi:hypothetical protein